MQSHMSQPGSSPDLKEGLFIGQDLPVYHPYCVEKKFNCGPNLWPEALDDLVDADNEAHCQNIIEDVKKLHEEYGYEMVDEDECEDGQIEKV